MELASWELWGMGWGVSVCARVCARGFYKRMEKHGGTCKRVGFCALRDSVSEECKMSSKRKKGILTVAKRRRRRP